MRMRRMFPALSSVFAFASIVSCSTGHRPSVQSDDKRSDDETGLGLGSGLLKAKMNVAADLVRKNPDKIPQDNDHEFSVRDYIKDANGTEHFRFERKYKGLRVVSGDFVTHVGVDGSLQKVNHANSSLISLDVTKPIEVARAVEVAKIGFDAIMEAPPVAELIVFAATEKPVLAYEVVLSGIAAGDKPTEKHVFVDARTATVVQTWEGIHTIAGSGKGFFAGLVPLETTLASGSYQLKDPSRGNQATNDMKTKTNGAGSLYLDADNQWGSGADGVSVAVDAQFGAAMTWDYFSKIHNRLGIKNNGIGALSKVHYGRKYNNAYWSDACFCMTYGDGDGVNFNPFVALDVAGHEMSHGITSVTAKLNYSGESGGLNEATSDIFGTMVEYFALNANDAPDYLIGEKLYKSGSGSKALRYMYNPALDGASPNCYSSTLGSLDVHYSSGVGNHFFYLLAEGSSPASPLPASPTCDGSSVVGIGRDKAAKIWYRALTVHMVSTTNYSGARAATLQAATDLFGAGSSEALAVTAAWDAVGVKN